MERRLFGESEREKREREEIKVGALVACQKHYTAVHECLKTSWFSWCRREQDAFWTCFLKERERLQLEKSAQHIVPEGHWKDGPTNRE